MSEGHDGIAQVSASEHYVIDTFLAADLRRHVIQQATRRLPALGTEDLRRAFALRFDARVVGA